MKLVYARRALRRLSEIAAYIRARNPSAAPEVERAIRDAVELLERHPFVGRSIHPGVRVLTVPRLPYLNDYQIDERRETVMIITLQHAAQDRPIS